MNVIDKLKSLHSSRGRNGRQNIQANFFPKNQFDGLVQPPYDYNTKMATLKTPARKFQGTTTSSSSVRRSNRRKGFTPYNTEGTASSSTPRTAITLPFIVALTEGRGDARREVGIAVVNVQYPHLILSQISDRQTYARTLTKILIFKPIEIIMPETMVRKSGTVGKLYECIKEKFPALNIAGVSRQHFNKANGLDRIKTLCAHEYSSVEIYVKQKFYALAAAGALLKYVEYTQNVLYIPKTMKIEFQSSEDTAIIDIDIESAQSLELVTHQKNLNKFTLLGILDRCLTPGGKRFLRASILQPSCKEHVIRERQACVTELVEDSTLLTSIQAQIRKLCDVDQLLVLGLNTPQRDNVTGAEKNLNYALSLKTTLEAIPFLQTALRTSKANFFRKVLEVCAAFICSRLLVNLEDPHYGLMMNMILDVLQPEARHVAGFNSSTMQRCFALKSGLNDMLDIARQAYCELIDDMKGMVETLALKYNLPFTLACNASLGYHIQMEYPRYKSIKTTDLPPIFIEVQRHKKNYLMTTEALLVLSQRCKDACEELYLMSNIMLQGVLNIIREHISCLYQLSNDIAELDVIVSLACISSLPNYTKPTFGSRIELKNSVHPLMDITGTCVPVPNDVYASLPHNFNIITGPNMGGKSVYLRQIVMLQIMAQIGCYVPAEKAQFRITDRIFCRLCFEDSIECNASSFVLEIKETQYILQTVTPKSLVIMDELCRGTTMEEGESIAFSICEQLLNTSAFVFFTTHFLSLTQLAGQYPNVTNYHFDTKCRFVEGYTEPRLIYTHKLNPGIIFTKNYGLALAETSGIRIPIVKQARLFAVKLTEKLKPMDLGGQISDAEGKMYYDELSLIHKKIEDNEFNTETVFEIIQKMLQNCNASFDKKNDSPSEQEIYSTANSMLSITERFNRIRQKGFLYSVTSNSDFLIHKSFLKPKARLSNFDSDGASPNKKLLLMQTSSSTTHCTNEPILPASGSPDSPYLMTFALNEETDSIEEQNSVHDSPNTKSSPCSIKKTNIEKKSFNLNMGFSRNSNNNDTISVIDLLTQLSTDTMEAKISARKKEANIFRKIEGDDFLESEFYGSISPRNVSLLTNIKDQ